MLCLCLVVVWFMFGRVSYVFVWLPQCWRRCVGLLCGGDSSKKRRKKRRPVISKQNGPREGIYPHYGFN